MSVCVCVCVRSVRVCVCVTKTSSSESESHTPPSGQRASGFGVLTDEPTTRRRHPSITQKKHLCAVTLIPGVCLQRFWHNFFSSFFNGQMFVHFQEKCTHKCVPVSPRRTRRQKPNTYHTAKSTTRNTKTTTTDARGGDLRHPKHRRGFGVTVSCRPVRGADVNATSLLCRSKTSSSCERSN